MRSHSKRVSVPDGANALQTSVSGGVMKEARLRSPFMLVLLSLERSRLVSGSLSRSTESMLVVCLHRMH